MPIPLVDPFRASLAHSIRQSVGGDPSEGHEMADPTGAGDPGWFGPGSVVWRVHGDFPAMLIGGVSSLLLQTLHPGAMAGVDEHSNWREDPLGRLQRTAQFLAITTFGTSDEAARSVRQVKAIHRRVSGVRPDGVEYEANDPDLLRWVHVAEVFQFLRSYQRYAFPPLRRAERDQYLAEVARVAEELGAVDVPHSVREVEQYLATVRPELVATEAALATARDLTVSRAPDPVQRAAYDVIVKAAVGLLPAWAREMLGLTARFRLQDQVSQAQATAMAGTLRWALSGSEVARNADARAASTPVAG
ncbi:MAG TPA: oxygenase MpaB family protein [Acidimicrobiales bacterium]